MRHAVILLAAAVEDSVTRAGSLWILGLVGASTALLNLFTMFTTFVQRRELEALERRVNEGRAEVMKIRDEVTADLQEFRAEMNQMERRLNEASEARALKNHERTNEILEHLAELSGKFEQSQKR